MEYYSAIKKNEILPFTTTWMQLESIMLSDNNSVRERQVRERQIPYDFTHMWNLRNKTNEQRKKRERDKPRNGLLTIENKPMVTRGDVGEGMGEIGDGD